MSRITHIFILLPLSILLTGIIYNKNDDSAGNKNNLFVFTQDSLDKNNISSLIWNSGVFNQDLRTNNTPGFIWPNGTIKAAIFTSGFTIAGYINNQLRMAAASYAGEYEPGYCNNGIFQTNNNFKIYKVTKGDNQNTNPDWVNWGLMVPYGAPFIDVNNNGIYEPAIDTPGIRGAVQTIFLCMTDADPTSHTSNEGFGGGTLPMGAEVHFTAWAYDNPGYQDMQFLKWVIINKNTSAWDSTFYSIVADPDVGNGLDDYVGCDTLRNLGFCYNSGDTDGTGQGNTYGIHPPAVGFAVLLNCSSSNLFFSSFPAYEGNCTGGIFCNSEPTSYTGAYSLMKGFKKDGSHFINVLNLQPTKFCYSGNPETNSGWTEYSGRVLNCGGDTGAIQIPSALCDRRFAMNFRRTNPRTNPGDTIVLQASQMIARGTNNLNSVTKLKQLADVAKQLCENNFIIGITPISTEIPKNFDLSQNYPNPFNPATKIRFSVPLLSEGGVSRRDGVVSLKIYNALGQEITTLVNEQLKPGSYSVDWNAANYPSGIYFYSLKSGDFSETKKLVLLK